MSVLRTQKQAFLQDALILTRESADHLDDAAKFVDDPAASESLQSQARERHSLAESLADALRSTGDLPSAPNVDREDAVSLVRRVRAWLTPDATQADFLAQHVTAERKLREVLASHLESDIDAEDRKRVEHVADHVGQTLSLLQSLADRLGR